ncbi:lipocalin family protein [Alteromonas sp. ASW11-19]|uniref:Outer membrane lipoprotein Blc n=1 Tax=Alteromonas salexigens TaxID=2982530 RepID=A0ABT2VMW1_9ALTE|nr:lipocalin family protein [Alteromonas salexigens]MCU7554584.1 lipocalin family protein [Alteromonas salexigens]
MPIRLPWFLCVCLMSLGLLGCTGKPDNVQPVTSFELPRYLGKWYEIARLPHSFEEGLSHVTAEYRPREEGGITVTNRGFNQAESAWEEANGKAFFVNDSNTGHLKVSFFGPFYASYIVMQLDDNYQHALVTGPDKDYLWILSRTPQLPEPVVQELVAFAAQKGYPVDELIYVDQQDPPVSK